MKKSLLVSLVILLPHILFAQSGKFTAQALRQNALQKDSLLESVEYIAGNLDKTASASDKRAALYFVSQLREQMGLYAEASAGYAKAAGIAAPDAAGMPKVTAEQMVLDAVRCCLYTRDCDTADSYLNSAVRSSSNQRTLAYVNLYSVWSALCRAETYEDTADSVALLKAYSSMESMSVVKPAVLFTIWYITGDSSAAAVLKKQFPSSPEAGIVNGKVNVAVVPFWYFIPRAGSEGSLAAGAGKASASASSAKTSAVSSSANSANAADAGSSSASANASSSTSSVNTQAGNASQTTKSGKRIRQQLGLFRSSDNADALVKKLKAAGFEAYTYEETRSSGTTYCIVVVNEDETSSMGKKLREAGFECYPVEY